MSTITTSSIASTTTYPTATTSDGLPKNTSGAGGAQAFAGISARQFAASIWVAAVVFVAQFLVFLFLKKKIIRLYEPRSFLVPEKKRVKAPKKGLFKWLGPIFNTKNADFITKSGLDAYFYLRYLRMLIKLVFCIGVLVVPVLIPINATGGQDSQRNSTVAGLDKLAWGNIDRENAHRHTAHLLMAMWTIGIFCYIVYDELRSYVRMRQAFLTSPQHRLRASATTVLVTAIPRKWMTYDMMINLYDVFPGGLKNVWLNRDYADLAEKIEERVKWVRKLEAAETALIKQCRKKKLKMDTEEAKKQEKEAAKNPSATVLPPPVQAPQATPQIAPLPTQAHANTDNPNQVRGSHEGHPRTSMGSVDSDSDDEGGHDKARKKVLGLGLPIAGIEGAIKDVKKDVVGFGENVKKKGGNLGDKMLFVLPDPDRSGYDGGIIDGNDDIGISCGEPNQEEEDERTGYHAHDDNHSAMEMEDGEQTVLQGPEGQTEPNDPAVVNGGGSFPFVPKRVKSLVHGPKWKNWSTEKKDAFAKRKSVAPEQDEVPLKTTTPHLAASDAPVMTKEERESSYPKAYKDEFNEDEDEPVWKKYLTEKDRETMRIPDFTHEWMNFLTFIPFVGKKVDTIYWCRREIARLTVEIEHDQANAESYPLMNSVFIQFESQIAAHMACQALNHHVPQHMAPRYLEVNPKDVIWENMRLTWWERYVRTGLITGMVIGMIIGWAIPVAFIASLSNLNNAINQYTWLHWLRGIDENLLAFIQGVLPPALIGLLLFLLPIVFRALAKYQGAHTGVARELIVQRWYFGFLFVQLFLVVSIASSLTAVLGDIIKNVGSTVSILAENLPKASNFFFSYTILQAFAVSGGALLQIGLLVVSILLSPFDNTARQKWARATGLAITEWGTLFPVSTNLACITLVYCVISPLILPFSVLLFGMFWIVYRYNLMFVLDPQVDSGGIFFPTAINQTFIGIYVMELALIGLFILVRDASDRAYCIPHAVIMIILLVATAIYQLVLNNAFAPLFQYLPVTLEDDAADADKAYAERYLKDREEAKRLTMIEQGEEQEQNGEDIDIEDRLRQREENEQEADERAEEIELENYEKRKSAMEGKKDKSDKDKKDKKDKKEKKKKYTLKEKFAYWTARLREGTMYEGNDISAIREAYIHADHDDRENMHQAHLDLERANRKSRARGELALFDHIPDELEDLPEDVRDDLVNRAFTHDALRARRPCAWIPRDELGVSDDEIRRTAKVTKYCWMSNKYTGFDQRTRAVYKRSPPDYDERDVVDL